MKIHSIKIKPEYFKEVVSGSKKAELRKCDRDYRVGDMLSLCEWKHGKYTGREWAAVITHVLPVDAVIPDSNGWVILSIQSITPLDALSYAISGGVA